MQQKVSEKTVLTSFFAIFAFNVNAKALVCINNISVCYLTLSTQVFQIW